MASFKNFYLLLDIPLFSEADAVKAAYRKLARQYHPDLHPNDKANEDTFKAINEAYSTLSDPERKIRYDHVLKAVLERKEEKSAEREKPSSQQTSTNATGREAYKNQRAESSPYSKSPNSKKATSPDPKEDPSARQSSGNTSKPEETESSTASSSGPASGSSTVGGFGHFFDSLFKPKAGPSPSETASDPASKKEASKDGASHTATSSSSEKSKKHRPVKGNDVFVDLELSPEEALSGSVKMVMVQHQELCRRCTGTGRLNGAICATCQGEKRMLKPRKLEVKIPSGVKPGSKIRVAKEGAYGEHGGQAGDLFITIRLISSAAFRMEGLNVQSELSLSIPQAVLGCDIEVLTLHGPLKTTIPPLSSSGQILRLKGQGQRQDPPKGNGNTNKEALQKGDHFVKLRIVSPTKLSEREKQLYEALRKEELKQSAEKKQAHVADPKPSET
jgi:DnaJ-class molecular chaperone